jgi:hypothetical protein
MSRGTCPDAGQACRRGIASDVSIFADKIRSKPFACSRIGKGRLTPAAFFLLRAFIDDNVL